MHQLEIHNTFQDREFKNLRINLDFSFEESSNENLQNLLITFDFVDATIFFDSNSITIENKKPFSIKELYNLMLLMKQGFIKFVSNDAIILTYNQIISNSVYLEIAKEKEDEKKIEN